MTTIAAVKDFPAYSVTTEGVIYRSGRHTPVAQTPNTKGYLTVNLSQGGVVSRRVVHRIVLEAFVGKRPPGMHGCHKNGDKRDNRLCNLGWASPTENEAHKKLHGTSPIGSKNGASKITEDQVSAIREAKLSGGRYWGAARLAERFGVATSTVIRAASGKQWGHVGDRNEQN